MARAGRGEGSIGYDEVKRTWRVAVSMDNGQRVYRRARSMAEAIAIRDSLLALNDRPLLERLRKGDTALDVSGLSYEQIAALLVMIQSWGGTIVEVDPE